MAPAIFLFFLSPLVAEFLLGDFTIAVLYLVFALAPMYGGGALLIRELVRRTGRGWPSIVLLALAFGVLEEGITTQSLFNPDYAGAHLLDQGFVPALGIAIPWTVFVLTLHTVWSISVPTALIEEWTPRRTVPWLKTPGLIVTAVLFLIGCYGTTMASYGNGHYWASWPKLLVVAVVVIALVVAAFFVPGRDGITRTGKSAPKAWVVLLAGLIAGALFFLTGKEPVWLGVLQMLIALAAIAAAILRWSRRAGWGSRHRFAAAASGLLTYAWQSFTSTPLAGGGPVLTPASHVFFAVAALVLLGFEWRYIAAAEKDTDANSEMSAMAPEAAASPGD